MNYKPVIIFIHGLHENAHCWIQWKQYFEQRGYACYAPSYPFHEGEAPYLRQNPNKDLRQLRLKHVVAYYRDFILSINARACILVGHSMGGLIVQKLIQDNIGKAGVCITSASPKGVFSFKRSFFKSNIGVVNPLKGNSLYCGTKEWFHYAICNTLTREESDVIYEKAVVPEGRNIARSSRFEDGYIDFSQPHKPLLFLSAEKDNIIPISLNIKNVKAYTDPESVTDFREFKGRSHGMCVHQGWEEIADYVDHWIKQYK